VFRDIGVHRERVPRAVPFEWNATEQKFTLASRCRSRYNLLCVRVLGELIDLYSGISSSVGNDDIVQRPSLYFILGIAEYIGKGRVDPVNGRLSVLDIYFSDSIRQ
jgi:hypothetical protein